MATKKKQFIGGKQISREEAYAFLTDFVREFQKNLTPEERLSLWAKIQDGYCPHCGKCYCQKCHCQNGE